MALVEVLRHHAFAEGLSSKQIAVLAGFASKAAFEENQLILEVGAGSHSFYLLTGGSVAVELRTPLYAVCVQALVPGDVFGWSALLDDQDTLFQVRAREHTTAIRLDGTALKAACRADTALGAELMQRVLKVVAGRVRATEVRFAEMCGVKV